MNQYEMFSSGLELATFVTSPDLLVRSSKVISDLYKGINSNEPQPLTWKVYKESDLTFVVFGTPSVDPQHPPKADLLSSSALKEKNFLHFEFLCTKSSPSFFLNSAAVSLFYENRQNLDQLKSEINSSTPLIVTGHALGGSVASLFTLSLLDSIGTGKKRPLCITFGSPLIGDKKLQQAISRSSNWNSCFLHVVSHKDPLPRLFITSHSSSAAQSSAQTSAYTPFGTFLLCSDVGSTCSENPDYTLELLRAMGSTHDQNQGLQLADYENIVEKLHRKAICKDFAARAEHITNANSLQTSIILQLWALGFGPQQLQQQNNDINALVAKMERQEKIYLTQKRTIFDPTKKLNVVKIDMAQLEWYKKDSKSRGIGYYDSYKKMLSTADQDVVKFQKNLTLYWEKMVEEAETKPQKEGSNFRKRWLFAGTNYRRMVEPLYIAQYYKNGGKDYEAERPKHYKQLEEWLKEGTADTATGLNSTSRHNVESILTIDSCFWSRVEKALRSCKQLKAENSSAADKEEARRKLLGFEDYVYGLLKNYAVSPEIFLKNSSYMNWWNEHQPIKGTSHNSTLASFMSKPSNHEQYALGAFDFR